MWQDLPHQPKGRTVQVSEHNLKYIAHLESEWQETRNRIDRSPDGGTRTDSVREQYLWDKYVDFKDALKMCLKIGCREDWVTADGYCETHREESHEKDLGFEEN